MSILVIHHASEDTSGTSLFVGSFPGECHRQTTPVESSGKLFLDRSSILLASTNRKSSKVPELRHFRGFLFCAILQNGDYLGTIAGRNKKAVCNCLERHTAFLICRQKLNQPNKPLSQPRISITPGSCSATSATIVATSNAPMIFPARWDFLGAGACPDEAEVCAS